MTDPNVSVHHLGDDRWIIALDGEHDISTQPMLTDALTRVFATGTRIVLDLSETTFIDSTVIRTLLLAHQPANQTPGEQLVIVAPPGGVPARTIALTGLQSQLSVYPDKTSALAAITAT